MLTLVPYVILLVCKLRERRNRMIIEITYDKGFYCFEYRKTDYCLRAVGSEYELMSKRQGYGGALHVPKFRHFETIEHIEKDIKGLKGLGELLDDVDLKEYKKKAVN